MRTSCNWLVTGVVVLLNTACACLPDPASGKDVMPQTNPHFSKELACYHVQSAHPEARPYEARMMRYGYANMVDERGDCYSRSSYPVTIILLIDTTGKVARSVTDVQGAKAACLREAYTGRQFSAPPWAPFRMAISLR